jgi:hypothetical protein
MGFYQSASGQIQIGPSNLLAFQRLLIRAAQ